MSENGKQRSFEARVFAKLDQIDAEQQTQARQLLWLAALAGASIGLLWVLSRDFEKFTMKLEGT